MLYHTFCNHNFKLAFGALRTFASLESSLRRIVFIISYTGDKVFKYAKFSKGIVILKVIISVAVIISYSVIIGL